VKSRTAAAVVVAVLAVACSSPVPPEPQANPEIVRVGPGLWSGRTDGPFQIQVDFGVDDPCGIIFTVDSRTSIVDLRSGQPLPATQEILVVGAKVSVTFTMVNQSCPGQSRADSVERLQ